MKLLGKLISRFKTCFGIKHIHGPKKFKLGMNEVVLLCIVRNGNQYVDSFYDHYKGLGISHFVFLENGSSDSTLAKLKRLDSVTILQSSLPYKENQFVFRQILVSRYAKNKWSLLVDIDEFFDYPFSDKVSLVSLITYLNKNRFTAMPAHILDMVPQSIGLVSKNFIKSEHLNYDISAIRKIPYQEIECEESRNFCVINSDDTKFYLGGIRDTLFNLPNLYLTKHPLLLNNGQTSHCNSNAHEVVHASIADVSGVLFHYKFLSNFKETIEDALVHKQYVCNSSQYSAYDDKFRKIQDPKLVTNNSKVLQGTGELINNGFLQVSSRYKSLAKSNE